jgi:hypothetical protein
MSSQASLPSAHRIFCHRQVALEEAWRVVDRMPSSFQSSVKPSLPATVDRPL